MTIIELDDAERAALAELLKATIEADRFFCRRSVRSWPKLNPLAPRPEPIPSPKPPGARSVVLAKKRRR